jgi:predicted DNA-binding WGR domain protein
MLMNFGPINRKGGEKRLNVIFSRAKKHMAVISSIQHYHITNDYNDGANYFKRFLHYAEMVSTGNMSAARTNLDGLIKDEQVKKESRHPVSITTAQIKKALESKGYVVNEQIGQSSFKCNLGIKKKHDDTDYALGVLVDDESHYHNDDLVEQYHQRPAILRSFGWQVICVFSKDWLEDSNKVLNMLLKQLEEKNDLIFVSENESKLQEQTLEKEEDTDLTKLVSANNERFWEISQSNEQLKIRFGKVGSHGQVLVKTYASNDEANFAKSRLIEEQVNQGFELYKN